MAKEEFIRFMLKTSGDVPPSSFAVVIRRGKEKER